MTQLDSMIGVPRQAVVSYCKHHNPTVPENRYGKGRRIGTAMLKNFITAFILNLSAMILLYLNFSEAESWLFFCAIILMIMSTILFTIEIQIANMALDAYLSNFEKHQEWRDYIERKNLDVNLH
jgi:hypothetical protein